MTPRRRSQGWIVFGAMAILNAAFGLVNSPEWYWQLLHLLGLVAWSLIVYREAMKIRSETRQRKGLDCICKGYCPKTLDCPKMGWNA